MARVTGTSTVNMSHNTYYLLHITYLFVILIVYLFHACNHKPTCPQYKWQLCDYKSEHTAKVVHN